MKKKAGTNLWCSITGQVIDPGNMAEGSIWMVPDITGRRRAAEALRAEVMNA